MNSSIEYIDKPLAILRPGGIASGNSNHSTHHRRGWDILARVQSVSDIAHAPLPIKRKTALIGFALLGAVAEIPMNFAVELAMPLRFRLVVLALFFPMIACAKMLHTIFMRNYFVYQRKHSL
jgi:hypothetical protein